MWFLSDFRFGQNNWHIGQVNPWDTKCLLSTCIFALVLILELYPHSVHVHVPSNCFANKEPTWASRSTTERIDVKYFSGKLIGGQQNSCGVLTYEDRGHFWWGKPSDISDKCDQDYWHALTQCDTEGSAYACFDTRTRDIGMLHYQA